MCGELGEWRLDDDVILSPPGLGGTPSTPIKVFWSKKGIIRLKSPNLL